jgi:lycopene beta-cyclase
MKGILYEYGATFSLGIMTDLMQAEKYDIIIAGAGMAGLSLVYRALKEGVWTTERILIIDKDVKDKNDRTWCFWQKKQNQSAFESIIYKQWEHLLFFSNAGEEISLNTGPYVYKMIRSIDFYDHVLEYIRLSGNVSFSYQQITSVESRGEAGLVSTLQARYEATYVFNSLYIKPELKPENQYFLQHFKGITIRTDQFRSDPAQMHLMDFRTSQENGTTFFYTLPISQNEIFVEYTLFSKAILAPEEYDAKIITYLSDVLKIDDFEILEEEFGIIPMTDFPFARKNGNVISLGSAGGDTRASTGYTFVNTQKTISNIITSFRKHKHPFFTTENISKKHKLLDATILKVLDNGVYQGHQIFTDLFKSVRAKTIFTFLDSESRLADDVKIMGSLKAKHFIGPFIKVLSGKA